MGHNGQFILQWHITHRCNLRCKHCYQDDYSAFQTRESMERVLDQFGELLREYDFSGHLNITGGEPLLHPDLFWLLKEASDRSMSTAVLTNGTLISLSEARRLKRCGVSYVQISLDGTRRVHDEIRGEGSFESAVRGISALRSQGIFTTISFTAQRGNMKELKKLARYCGYIGADKLWFDRVVIPSDEDDGSLSLSSEEYRKLCKTAAKLNKRGEISCARALQFLPCESKQIYSCTAGKTLLALLADGTVMPCRRLPVEAGNIGETDLLTIYRDSPVLRSLRETGIPEGCSGCEYKELCRGGSRCVAFARTGRYDIPDPDCTLCL